MRMNAKESLLKAVSCDRAGRFIEALFWYKEGIQILLKMVSVFAIADEKDAAKKNAYNTRIKEYIDRAEELQNRVRIPSTEGEKVAIISIVEGSTGHSYNSLFGKYLTEEVQEVLVRETYLQQRHQFHNLIMFLELLVKNCSCLKYVHLITRKDENAADKQMKILDDLKLDLAKRSILFRYEFEEFHDRRIVLGNGYVIELGRGLDFYKPQEPLYSIGLNDYDFRECKDNRVLIWRRKL